MNLSPSGASLDRRTLVRRGAEIGAALALWPSEAAAAIAPAASAPREPADLGLLEAAALLRARRISSVELTEACLLRAHRDGDPLNAWVRTYEERAIRAARRADRRFARRGGTGPRSLADGIPVGLKEIIAVDGRRLTASSEILTGRRATADSAAWRRLRAAGMVLLGHNQTHEFAAGNFTPQSANPWDPARTPGGSSGGGAIALAQRMVPAAIGSDTLGSLRIPASFCGLTTIKPTLGAISTRGVIPLARSFDTVGPMARSARDVSLLLALMSSSADRRSESTRNRGNGPEPLAGVRIGIPDQNFGGLEPEAAIGARVEAFSRQLQRLGARLVSFVAPRSRADNLSSAEGFDFFLRGPGREIDDYHRRYFPERSAEYTDDVRTLLTLARSANTPDRDPAPERETVRQLRRDWREAFRDARLDAVLQPAALMDPPERTLAPQMTQRIGDPMVVWNYTGFPVACLPAGLSRASGLPVGVQLAGLPGRERELLWISAEAQRRFPHHRSRPPL